MAEELTVRYRLKDDEAGEWREATQWFPGLDVEGVIVPEKWHINNFKPHVVNDSGVTMDVDPGDWVDPDGNGEGPFVYSPDEFDEFEKIDD